MKSNRLIIISLACLLVTFILYAVEIQNYTLTRLFYYYSGQYKITYIDLLGLIGLVSLTVLVGSSIAAAVVIFRRRKDRHGEPMNKKTMFIVGGSIMGVLILGSLVLANLPIFFKPKTAVIPEPTNKYEQPVISSSTVGQTSSVAIADGHYETTHGFLDIQKIAENTVRFQAHAEWVGNAELGQVNEGDVEGKLILKSDNTAVYKNPDNADCTLHFSFTENVVKIEDANTACGGMNVSFRGEYKKTPSGTQKSNWSLMDYYNAIPPEFLLMSLDKARQEIQEGDYRGKIIVDDANYYMSFFFPEEDFNTQVAVFLRPPRTGLISVVNAHCRPGCSQDLHFLDLQNGRWVDVKDKVFPEPTEEEIFAAFKRAEPNAVGQAKNLKDYEESYTGDHVFNPQFVLPRYGTTIKLVDHPIKFGEDVTLMSWKWNGKRFELINP